MIPIVKAAYVAGGFAVGLGMSVAQAFPAQSPTWLTGLNTLLLSGTMTLLGWSLITVHRVSKRQDVLEAALFKGTSVTNGARQFLSALEENFAKLNEKIEKLSREQGERLQTLETTLWGVKGHGGLLGEVKSLRESRHEHGTHLMTMMVKVENIEKDLESLRRRFEQDG